MRLSYANSLENITDGAAARWASCSSVGSRLMAAADRRHAPDPRAGARAAARGRRRLGLAARPAARREPSCTRRWPAPTAVVTLLHDRVDDAFLDAAGPRLRVVANVAVGLRQRRRRRVRARAACVVTNTPGVLTEATADIAFALILMATRRLGEGERLIRAQRAVALQHGLHARHGDPGQDARDRRARADRRRHGAARPRVRHGRSIYSGRRRGRPAGRGGAAARTASTSTSCSRTADVVSLHCPLTPETRHLIDGERLRQMKPTATSSTRRAARSSTRRRWPTRSATA